MRGFSTISTIKSTFLLSNYINHPKTSYFEALKMATDYRTYQRSSLSNKRQRTVNFFIWTIYMAGGKRHKRTRSRATTRGNRMDTKAPIARKLTQIPISDLLTAISEFKPTLPPSSPASYKLDPPYTVASKRFFKQARIRPFSLRFDRPDRIIGCREQAGQYRYVVQFRCGAPLYAGFTVVGHEELMKTAPWLLAEYVLGQYQ